MHSGFGTYRTHTQRGGQWRLYNEALNEQMAPALQAAVRAALARRGRGAVGGAARRRWRPTDADGRVAAARKGGGVILGWFRPRTRLSCL